MPRRKKGKNKATPAELPSVCLTDVVYQNDPLCPLHEDDTSVLKRKTKGKGKGIQVFGHGRGKKKHCIVVCYGDDHPDGPVHSGCGSPFIDLLRQCLQNPAKVQFVVSYVHSSSRGLVYRRKRKWISGKMQFLGRQYHLAVKCPCMTTITVLKKGGVREYEKKSCSHNILIQDLYNTCPDTCGDKETVKQLIKQLWKKAVLAANNDEYVGFWCTDPQCPKYDEVLPLFPYEGYDGQITYFSKRPDVVCGHNELENFGYQVFCPECNREECARCLSSGYNGHIGQMYIDHTCQQYREIQDRLQLARSTEEKKELADAGCVFCPVCQAPVNKSEGCDHMTCTCGTHFCYVCGLKLGQDGSYGDHIINIGGEWRCKGEKIE